MKPPTGPSPAISQARRELLLVVLLSVVAAGLRFSGFGTLGLTHFDEGVYAQSGLWAVLPSGLWSLDPQVIAYAPPGFPVLVGLAYLAFGVSDLSAILVSLVFGVAAVPVAGWVGRRTFGPGAGVAAAALAALSCAQIAFSRKALTDAPFLLAWLAAVGLGGRFLERPRVGRALAFGLAVGVAQNLKYNGWVLGVVVAVAAVLGAAVDGDERKRAALLRTFGLGLLAALVAAVLYGPWYRFVEGHGGYADLVRHHRSYMSGPERWIEHWRTQLAQAVALSGGLLWGCLSFAVAWLGAGVAVNGSRLVAANSRWGWSRLRVGLFVGAVGLALIPDLTWWVGLAWSPWLLLDRRPAPRVLGAWWLVLSVMTPFYHPYARLWLPLHAAGWLLLSGAVVRLGPFSEGRLDAPGGVALRRPRVLAQAAAAVACVALAATHWPRESPRPLPGLILSERTDSLRNAVALAVSNRRLLADPNPSLRVLARRPVIFYLGMKGSLPFRVLPDRSEIVDGPGPTGEWALVDEVQFGESLRDGMEGVLAERKWRRQTTWEIPLDAVTLLDVSPAAAYPSFIFEDWSLILLSPPRPRVGRRGPDGTPR